MSLTRAAVETILVKRCGPLLTAAGMAITFAGANADLNDPIGYAIRKSSGTVASFTSVTNTDLNSVDSTNYDQLIDLAELRTLETILGNLDDVDIRVGPRDEKLSQLRTSLEERVKRLQERIQDEYGITAASLEAGTILMDFADHNETLAEE